MNFIGFKKLLGVVFLQSLLAVSVFAAQPVNVNKADAATIASSLNGIGDSKAKAIVEYRTKNGPFKSLEQLSNVKGIGEKTIEKNKQYIQLK